MELFSEFVFFLSRVTDNGHNRYQPAEREASR
jgi:hypothetical protein